jgi:4-hydroxy-tetrahydrodipicolinate reductase
MNISIIGYGKMGKEIEQLSVRKGHHIYSIVDPLLGTNLDVLKGTDMAIEFTQPTSAVQNIRYCIDNQIPIVSGTTGWHQELESLKEYCRAKSGTFFYSSNFSIGVHLFWKVSGYLAEKMDSFSTYKLGLHEIHHDQKKDAPSGTAVTLADTVLKSSQRFTNWNKSDQPAWAEGGSIPISSDRIGQVCGTHVVEYKSDHDRLIFTHEAFSRGGFVSGVVTAAEWLKGRTGVFGMDDLFNSF